MTISKIDNSVLFYDVTFDVPENFKILQIESLYNINLKNNCFI